MSLPFNPTDATTQPSTRHPRALDDPPINPNENNVPSLIALCLQQANLGEVREIDCQPVAQTMNKLGNNINQQVAPLQAQLQEIETQRYSLEVVQGAAEERIRLRDEVNRHLREIRQAQREIHAIPIEMIQELPEEILSRLSANFLNNMSLNQWRVLDTTLLSPQVAQALSPDIFYWLDWHQTQSLSLDFIQAIPEQTIQLLLQRYHGAVVSRGGTLNYDLFRFGPPRTHVRPLELPVPRIFDLSAAQWQALTPAQTALFLNYPLLPPEALIRLVRGRPERIAALDETSIRRLMPPMARQLQGDFLDRLTQEQVAWLQPATLDVLRTSQALLATARRLGTNLSVMTWPQLQMQGPIRLLLFLDDQQFASLSTAFFEATAFWHECRHHLTPRELHALAARLSAAQLTAAQLTAAPAASITNEYFYRHLVPELSPRAVPSLFPNILREASEPAFRRWSLAHYRQLNAEQIPACLERTRFSFFSLRAIRAEVVGRLNAHTLLHISEERYGLRIQPFSRAQWAHVTPATLRISQGGAYIPNGFIETFSDSQLRWWSAAQVAAVFARCRLDLLQQLLPQLVTVGRNILLNRDATRDQIRFYDHVTGELTADDIRAMIESHVGLHHTRLSRFNGEFFMRLQPSALAVVPTAIIRRRTRSFTSRLDQAQRRALTAAQIAVFSPDALSGFAPEALPDLNLSQITSEQLRQLTPQHIQQLTTAQLRQLPIAVLRAMGREEALRFYRSLTLEQEAALTDEQKAFFQDLIADVPIEQAGNRYRRPPDDGAGGGGTGGGDTSGGGTGGRADGGQRRSLRERMSFKGLANLFGHKPKNRAQKIALLTQFDIQEGGAALWNNIITPITLSRNSLPASPNGLPGLEIIDDDAEYALLVGQLRQDQMTSLSAQTLQNLERVASHIRPQQYFWLQEAQRQALVRNERYFHVTLETVWREIMPDQAALQALLGRAPERGLPLPMRVPLATYQAVLDRVDWSRVQTVLTPQKIAELGRDPSSWLLFLLPPKAFGEAGSHVWSSDQLAEIPDSVKAFWSADYWNAMEPVQWNGALARDINTIALAEMPKLKELFFEFPHDDAEQEAKYRARLQHFDSAHIQAIPLDRRTDKFYSRYLDANQFALLTAQQLKVIPVAVMQKLPSPLWLALREDQLREQFAKLDQAHATAFIQSWFAYLATLSANTPARRQAVSLLRNLQDWQLGLIEAAQLAALPLDELDGHLLNRLTEHQVQALPPSEIATIPATAIASLTAFLAKLHGPQITALIVPQLAAINGEAISAWGGAMAELAPDNFRNAASEAQAITVEKVLFQASRNKEWLMSLKAHMQRVDTATVPVAIWQTACNRGGADFIALFSIAQREALTAEQRAAIGQGTYIELIQQLYARLTDQEIQPDAGTIPATAWRHAVMLAAEEVAVDDDQVRRWILNDSFRVKISADRSPNTTTPPAVMTSTAAPSKTMPYPIDAAVWPIETQIPPPPGDTRRADTPDIADRSDL